jgi:hypothetical protein
MCCAKTLGRLLLKAQKKELAKGQLAISQDA